MNFDRTGTRRKATRTGFYAYALGLGLSLALTCPVSAQPPDTPDASSGPGLQTGGGDQGQALEAVRLSVNGFFTMEAPRVGDSLDYVLRVEWPDAGVPVAVLAPDSLDFQGFQVIGQSTLHKKLATPQGVSNRTDFIYRLRARAPGAGKASSLRLRYLSGLSRNEEAVHVPTAHVDIAQARTPLTGTLWFRMLAGLLGLAAAAGIGWGAFRLASRRKPKDEEAKDDLRPDMLALRDRLRKAAFSGAGDSKDILLQMEAFSVRHLRQELGGRKRKAPEGSGDLPAKFEPLLERWLAANGSAARAEDWKALQELYRHARFAGGHKEPHELQEAYRTLRRCLDITDEPGAD
jgi:hypothetical protein